MNLKLTSEDRNAIDLLLDEVAAASNDRSQAYVPPAEAEHLHAVRGVLQLLQILPASEPPVDLVAGTLAHISQATGQIFEMPATMPHRDDGQPLRSA